MKAKKYIFLGIMTYIIYTTTVSQQIEKNVQPLPDKTKDLPTVVIITTGGTIAEKTDPKTEGAIPAVSGKNLLKTIPGLNKIANLEVIQFCNVDSSRITPKQWQDLSQKVDEVLKNPKVSGVVVTHGTDTMAEGAYFLDLTIQSEKPVVFVGAMRNTSDLSPDGPSNLYNAVLQIISEEAKGLGVTVTLNQYINSARHVRKTETTNMQTFNSGEYGYLGYIAMEKVHKFHDPIPVKKIPLPKKLSPEVILLKTFSGDDGRFIKYAVDTGAKGIVVEGVGAGNVNQKVFAAIKYALSKKVVIIITTRVFNGAVYPIYGGQGGGKTLEAEGAIMGGDITGPKARIKLMLLLSQKSVPKDLKQYFEF